MTEQSTNLRFERRPSYVLPEHRPLYKIAQVLLILYLASRDGKSTLPRLHLFNWALKSDARHKLLEYASENKFLTVPAWGFDPVLAIGVRFAIAEDLIQENTTGYEITEAGVNFVQKIIEDDTLFVSEKNLIRKIGKRITEKMVDVTARGWEIE
jgi:hypothetical protein